MTNSLLFLFSDGLSCDAVYVLLRGLARGIELCSSHLGMQNWIGSPSFAVLLPLSLTPAPWDFTSYYSGSTEPFAQALLFWGPILRHPVAEKSRLEVMQGLQVSPRVLSGVAAFSNRLFPHATKMAPRGSILDASRFIFHR